MRICILNSVHPPWDTRVLRIIETLSTKYQIISISPHECPEEIGNALCYRANIRFVKIKNKSLSSFRTEYGNRSNIYSLFSRIRVMRELFVIGLNTNADLYWCNEVDSWFIGILIKILRNKKVIFDAHEYYPAILSKVIGREKSYFPENLFNLIFRFMSRFTNGCITVNQSLLNLYKFKTKSIIIRNCIKSSDTFLSDLEKEEIKDNDNSVILLHLGTSYGIDPLLKALININTNRPWVCLIIGDDFHSDKYVSGMLKKYNLENNVRIISRMPFNQIKKIISTADIGLCIIPPYTKSVFYSLPRKFLEYISFSLPVISSNFPEIQLVIEKYNIGFTVNPLDEIETGKKIEKLINEDNLRKAFRENCITAFKNELCWENEEKKLIHWINAFENS